MAELDDLVKEFLVESNENLDRLDQDFVALEKDPAARERLASIFRTIHTIKGTCGFLGFSKLESVTHVGESLLSKLRDGELGVTSEIITGLLTMVDAVRQMLSSIEAGQGEGVADYTGLIATLTALKDGPAAGAPAPRPAAQHSPAPSAADIAAAALSDVDAQIAAALAEMDVTAATPAPQGSAPAGPPAAVSSAPAKATPATPAAPPAVDHHDDAAAASAGASASSGIRVDVGLLDKLMNLVGELVLARNQILQFSATIENATLSGSTQRLNLITTELQEGVMKTRMQPIGNIWGKFPRIVRDLSQMCGKRVRVEMEGKETELDKTIIEAIKDPLTHIIRNSVDHGIETPEARRAAGKAEEGLLYLRAFHEGGQVNIEIVDDGGGINTERVKRKAVERGLVTAEHAARMGDREATNLIFLPGFSTAEKVTNVSGRGVGMDVVKTNIEKIGGAVDIQSKLGQGTTLRIKIPLTLAIIPALVVTSAGDRFAIPQVSLLELVRLGEEQARTGIENIHGTPVYRLRGNLLPLVYLNRQLGTASEADSGESGAVNIIVLQADERQFGLVVDEINDTEEIVVKPLGKLFKGLTTFAGATIMGDGRVALILDVMGLAQRSGVVTEGRDRAMHDPSSEPDDFGVPKQTLLLFRVSGTRRMALPLSKVARLEEFPRESVEMSGDQQVMQYRGGIMPLVPLSQVLGHPGGAESRPAEDADTIQVIVYSRGEQSVGLVVDRIVDIVEEAVVLQRTGVRPGVLGAAVIEKKVTEMLDVEGVVRAALATSAIDTAGQPA